MSKLVQLILVAQKNRTLDLRGEKKLFGILWWRFRGSNPGPADYDFVALTNRAKLPRLMNVTKKQIPLQPAPGLAL